MGQMLGFTPPASTARQPCVLGNLDCNGSLPKEQVLSITANQMIRDTATHVLQGPGSDHPSNPAGWREPAQALGTAGYHVVLR